MATEEKHVCKINPSVGPEALQMTCPQQEKHVCKINPPVGPDPPQMTCPQQEKHVCKINPPVGPDPLQMTCPHCQETMTSNIELKSSARTHTLCIVFSMFGCFLCGPCIYCNDDCLAKEHYCSKCGKYVGTYDG